jgi:pyruvate/2-oxoglutarate dehydrogenase complex dihydrolipoamide acyltransferase (E2) component|tara:strand:- start:435 stop:707 length:273 start_codon:yes stop_codon:yes gene_type:complete
MSKEKIILPAMSDQMTEAELLKWNIAEGSDIKKGDIIAEISTDKVDMDLDSPFTGKVTNLLVEEGSVINVGETLAEVETEEESLLGSIFD